MPPSRSLQSGRARTSEPRAPGFSLRYMDRSVSPERDFYRYAVGSWVKRNPVPSDKSRWGAFGELDQYNVQRLHRLMERRSRPSDAHLRSVADEVARFYAAAMDTSRRNQLRFRPIEKDLRSAASISSLDDLVRLLASLHNQGSPALFSATVHPDKKRSRFYALYIEQDGLSLPDRDYYLAPGFQPQRKAFQRHLVRAFSLLGDTATEARREAGVVLRIETELAKASRTRTELRDELKNYNKTTLRQLRARVPSIRWDQYFKGRGAKRPSYVIVGQPDFLSALQRLLRRLPLSDWKVYVRWHILRAGAPFLHREIEDEHFQFNQRTLLGQKVPEPQWRRALRAADRSIGDALGQLFVAEYFPPSSTARMKKLVADVKEVFRDRLEHLPWMTAATRRRALAKFARFTTKIGHPRHFRNDSTLRIDRRSYLGNVQRATEFESRRKMARLGHRVDPDDWQMTAPQVNAYFDGTRNEIVFPAGILQPPFFDPTKDDAVNYGAIGLVIGHEITHGYDDQGRRYDEHGNLQDWWTQRDAGEFQRRAKKIVEQYDRFEPLPGAHIKGALTLGENIADLGGVSIAFEALQRRLAKDPASRRPIDGLTPEQRFFISYAQIWRETVKAQDARRLLTIDPHSPGPYRVLGPLLNTGPFFDAFQIRREAPMFRPEKLRVQIW
jgi:putative endopeptidase